jgi:hypothetical protein
MKIKQICLIIILIALSCQLNLNQDDYSGKAVDVGKITEVDTNDFLPGAPVNNDTQPRTTTKPNVENNSSAPKQPDINNSPSRGPFNSNNIQNDIRNDINVLRHNEAYRPSAMVPNTPICHTPAPVVTPFLNPTPAIIRPYARILPPQEPLRVFVPQHRLFGPPVSQPSPIVETTAYPVHRVAPLQPVPIATPVAAVAQPSIAVAQPSIAVAQNTAAQQPASPLSEKDLKITVNKKKKNKIELTISAKPKEN